MNRITVRCWECNKVLEEHEGYIPFFYETFGEKIEYSLPYSRKYCKECNERLAKEEAEKNVLYIKLKKERMFNKACYILEKQGYKMYEHKEAIDVVRDAVKNKPDKFDSSYEMIAAIILVDNRIYAKMQYKIKSYQVDFLLPEIGVVLEIDGERHKYTKGKDSTRDEAIKKELGAGWDIIRIPTNYLDKDASKLIEAIERVIDYRECGVVPWRKIIKEKHA